MQMCWGNIRSVCNYVVTIYRVSQKYNNSKCFSSLREQKSSKDLAQHLAAANLINTQSEEYFNSSLYNTLSSDVFQIS